MLKGYLCNVKRLTNLLQKLVLIWQSRKTFQPHRVHKKKENFKKK